MTNMERERMYDWAKVTIEKLVKSSNRVCLRKSFAEAHSHIDLNIWFRSQTTLYYVARIQSVNIGLSVDHRQRIGSPSSFCGAYWHDSYSGLPIAAGLRSLRTVQLLSTFSEPCPERAKHMNIALYFDALQQRQINWQLGDWFDKIRSWFDHLEFDIFFELIFQKS